MRIAIPALFLCLSTATPSGADPEKEAFDTITNMPGINCTLENNQLERISAVTEKVTDQTIVDIMKHRAGLSKLKGIHIQGSKLSDAGMKEIRGLPSLTYLWLMENRGFTDTGLAALKDLPKLRNLELYGTPVTGTGLDPAVMPSLGYLNMANCPVSSQGIRSIAKHKNLWYLDLTHGPAKDIGPLKELSHLHEIKLSHSDVDDESMLAFSSKSVEKMSLRGTKVTCATLKGFTALRHLDLDLTRTTDDGLKGLAELKLLRSLTLAGTKVTDEGLKHLAGLTDLQLLDLNGTKVKGSGIKHLSECKTLQELRLPMNDEVFKALVEMKMLRIYPNAFIRARTPRSTDQDIYHLSLAETEITDESLKALHGFKSLKHLVIVKTKTTDEGVMELQKALPGLKVYR